MYLVECKNCYFSAEKLTYREADDARDEHHHATKDQPKHFVLIHPPENEPIN